MDLTRRTFLAASAALAATSAGGLPATASPGPHADKRGPAPGRMPSLAAKRSAPDPAIAKLAASVDRGRIAADLAAMTALGTRWTYGPNPDAAPALIARTFRDAGYSAAEVRSQTFVLPQGGERRNVICGPAALAPGTIALCAHHDSISEDSGTFAPGADDNASGLAAMLEAARVLGASPHRELVIYMAFGGEEEGLLGSAACAEIAAAEGWPMALLLNLDMIGYVGKGRPSPLVIEFDQGNARSDNDRAARNFAQIVAEVAATYSPLPVEHSDIWNSDYMPFEAKGYPCVGLYDAGGESSFYHSTADTLDVVDLDRVVGVTKLVVASIATLLGRRP